MNKLEYQKEIKERIDLSFENNKLFHAYIFSGEKNCGQLELAKYFAKKLVNDHHLVDSLDHPNVFYIDSETNSISKEEVLNMAYEMHTTSLSGNNKVFIVNDAYKLTVSAQNSLLKIIEDPVGSNYVIFIIENLNQLLSTIRSRSQIVKFKPMPLNILFDEVANDYDDKLRLKYAIYLSSTNFNDLYNDTNFDIYLEIVYDYLRNYFRKTGDIVYSLEEICYMKCSDKKCIINFLNLLIANVESIISYKNLAVNEIFDERFIDLIDNVETEQLIQFLNSIFDTIDMINNNVNVKLAIDNLTIGGSRNG